MTLAVKWVDEFREPKCQPDPLYPKGVRIDVSNGAEKVCETDLPYPAKRCGHFIVSCSICGLKVAVTTAGRPDDPNHVTFACKDTKH